VDPLTDLKGLCNWGLVDLIKLCQLAYSPDQFIADEVRALGLSLTRVIHAGPADAIVVEDEHRFVVAIRGTQPGQLRDVIADGRFCPERSDYGGLVHRGFWNHAQSLWEDLVDVGILETRKPLTICGHSLGGAAATHIALYAGLNRSSGRSNPHLLTVGAPRIGTSGYHRQVRKHTASITRVVNHRDPVPLFLSWLYSHPRSRVVYFDHNGLAHLNPSFRKRLRHRGGSYGKVAKTFLSGAPCQAAREMFPAHNHYMTRYVQLCQDLCRRVHS